MNIAVNNIVKFDDNEYLVLDVIDNRYLYLINNKRFEKDLAIVKITNKNGKVELNYIENDDEFNYAVCKIYVDFKRDILKYFD